MNTEIPNNLDDAKIIEYSLSSKEKFGISQDKNGNKIEIASIAIATYDDDQYYLFSCDRSWNVVGDLVYDTLEEAKLDALRWYDVSKINWIKK